jgi:5-methylcytosine-specific restriction endonuclease McrA
MDLYQIAKDSIGKKFNKLTLVELIPTSRQHVKCLCDCGKIVKLSFYDVYSNIAPSCGCYIHNSKIKMNQRGFEKLFKRYQNGAWTRNYDFDLTMEQFQVLITAKCHYCGTEPKTEIKICRRTDTFKEDIISSYNGIDRIDNDLGYTLENSVTCCKHCNYLKRNQTYGEFLAKIKEIYFNLCKYIP